MNKRERALSILKILKDKFGQPKCALNYSTPFELLVAVVLSAQCTDKRVNIVTEKVFKKYNTPEDFVKLDIEEIEKLIKSTGFYRNKAKNIKSLSNSIINSHSGEVPKKMNDLINLAGVGRKTANVVRGEIWGIAEGIVVDTHVKRLSNLIGLVNEKSPEKIEKELMEVIAKKYWIDFSHYLILQGRDKCIARNPKCQRCEIIKYCKYGISNK